MPPSPAAAPSSPPSSSWQADGDRVRDARFNAAATLDLADPRRGVRPRGVAGAGGLLGVDLPPPFRLTDHWLRGADAAAVYESADERRLRVTAMWRQHAAAPGVQAWELILSAQTALLHSDPRLAVVSLIPIPAGADAARWLWAAPAGGDRIWRDEAAPGATSVLVEPGGAAAGAEAVVVVGHPGEVERLEVRREAGGVVIAAPIFAGDLEKGVLLRGRVLAATGPAATARSWARDLAVAFADTAPMLSRRQG